MKCEPALTEGRGQAFSLHLPLTVPLFMRLTFARWKGQRKSGERKTSPAAGPEQSREERGAVPGCAGPGCAVGLPRLRRPLFPGVTPSPLGSSGLPSPAGTAASCQVCAALAPCLGSPGHPAPACAAGRIAAPGASVAAGCCSPSPEGGHGTRCWGPRGQPSGRSLRCPLPGCAVPGACCRLGWVGAGGSEMGRRA